MDGFAILCQYILYRKQYAVTVKVSANWLTHEVFYLKKAFFTNFLRNCIDNFGKRIKIYLTTETLKNCCPF